MSVLTKSTTAKKIKASMGIEERFWRFVAKWITLPPFLFMWLGRHKTIRKILLIVIVIIVGVSQLAPEVMAMVLQLGAQLIFGFAFMVVQFGGLMYFMSQTKTTIIYPGDEGALTWDDYWGNKPVQQALQEWTSLLTEKKRFIEMGGTIPRGILMVGPPGTGKTYAAQALAGSAGVPFRGIEGSGFRGMFWGMDVMRMIQFINGAKSMARESPHKACIAYIDELEAIGARRGGGSGEGQQAAGGLFGGMMTSGALTRLLVMMDGMEDMPLRVQLQNKILKIVGQPLIEAPAVLFVGSTNRPQDLDPALTRSGRFGKRIVVDPPDKGSRRMLILGYLGKIKHVGIQDLGNGYAELFEDVSFADDDAEEYIDVEALVQDTAGRTPADIAAAIEADAVRIAHFDDRHEITQLDIEDAFQEQLMGIKNPISDLEPRQKRVLAIHEAGHAIAQYHLRKDMRIVRVSILRRSKALGYMLPVTKQDIYATELETFVHGIMVSLAGHVAVLLVNEKAWTGAFSDFEHVRQYINTLHSYAYFELFPTDLIPTPFGVNPDKEKEKKVQAFIEECMVDTTELLTEHRDALDALWGRLLEKEDLTGTEAVGIIESFLPAEEVVS
jgi:cell division protease FtsH